MHSTQGEEAGAAKPSMSLQPQVFSPRLAADVMMTTEATLAAVAAARAALASPTPAGGQHLMADGELRACCGARVCALALGAFGLLSCGAHPTAPYAAIAWGGQHALPAADTALPLHPTCSFHWRQAHDAPPRIAAPAQQPQARRQQPRQAIHCQPGGGHCTVTLGCTAAGGRVHACLRGMWGRGSAHLPLLNLGSRVYALVCLALPVIRSTPLHKYIQDARRLPRAQPGHCTSPERPHCAPLPRSA